MPLPNINYYRYQPISAAEPVDAYTSAVDAYTKQYDLNLDNRNKVAKALASIPASKGDQDYLNKLSENVNKTLEGVAKTVQGTTNWGYAGNAVNEAANILEGDKIFQGIKMNHDIHLKSLEIERKLAEKGKVVNVGDSFEDHKTLNADGTVNIFKPLYQNEADQVAAASALTKNIPGIADIHMKNMGNGLLRVDKEHIVTNQIIKDMLPVYLDEYKKGPEAQQLVQVRSRELRKQGMSEEKIKSVIDKELEGTMRTVIQRSAAEAYKSDVGLQADPQFAADLSMQKLREGEESKKRLIKYKEDEKRNGSKSANNHEYLSTSTGINNQGSGDQTRDGITKWSNDKIFKSAVDMAESDAPIGGNHQGKVITEQGGEIPKDARITKFKPVGINAKNSFPTEFDAAWYGTIDYKVGDKEFSTKGYVRNTDTSFSGYSLNGEIHRKVIGLVGNKSNMKNGFGVETIDSPAVANLFTDASGGPQTAMIFKIIGYQDGGHRVKPMVKIKVDGKEQIVSPKELSYSDRVKYGLLNIADSYTEDQLRDLQDNKLGDQAEAWARNIK